MNKRSEVRKRHRIFCKELLRFPKWNACDTGCKSAIHTALIWSDRVKFGVGAVSYLAESAIPVIATGPKGLDRTTGILTGWVIPLP
jgi:hypothetical protein